MRIVYKVWRLVMCLIPMWTPILRWISWLISILQISLIMIINTLRPRQNGRRFADNTFKHIFMNENVRISIKNSLKFVPKGPINNNPVLVQIMAWRRSGNKPLSEPVMVSLLTHICVTRPQWVKMMVPCQISHSYLAGVAAAELQKHLSNMNVTQSM